MNNTITINIPKSVKSELTQLRADNAALRAEVARLALLDNLARDAIAVAKRERDLSIRKYFEANEELFALRARLAAADELAVALDYLDSTLTGRQPAPGSNFEVTMKGHKWNSIIAAYAAYRASAAPSGEKESE